MRMPFSIPEVFAGFDGSGEWVLHVPAFVDDRVLPTELANAGEDGGIGAVVAFVDGEAVGIPAVPAHGWGGGRTLSGQSAECAGNESNAEKQD